MEAAGEVNNYAMLRQAARHGIYPNNHTGILCHLGLFFMVVAASFIIPESGLSYVDSRNTFMIFFTFILGLWMVILSLVLPRFPVMAGCLVPLAMEAVLFFVFGLRIDLLF